MEQKIRGTKKPITGLVFTSYPNKKRLPLSYFSTRCRCTHVKRIVITNAPQLATLSPHGSLPVAVGGRFGLRNLKEEQEVSHETERAEEEEERDFQCARRQLRRNFLELAARGACVCPSFISVSCELGILRDRKLAKLDHPCD